MDELKQFYKAFPCCEDANLKSQYNQQETIFLFILGVNE